jgi:hypothetical protein
MDHPAATITTPWKHALRLELLLGIDYSMLQAEEVVTRAYVANWHLGR